MKLTKIEQLRDMIRTLEEQKAFFNSAISICMADANLIDLEIEEYIKRGQEVEQKIRDYKAELADTI